MITNHDEGTIELLRYILGGNRPSQTDPLTLFPTRIHGMGLEFQLLKTGISLTTPPGLTSRLHSLPAMLHMKNQNSISEYSKGARGLSVLLWVSGIYTGSTISPRSSLRQRPDRYTIRAGRNLPVNEFRYLRTVIVTADIHRGFSSELPPHLNPPDIHIALRTAWSRFRCGVTPCLNLSALVTCHTLYILLRVRRVLCF